MGSFSNGCVASCKEADGIIPGMPGLDIPGAPLNASTTGSLLTLTSSLSRATMPAMMANAKLNLIASLRNLDVRIIEYQRQSSHFEQLDSRLLGRSIWFRGPHGDLKLTEISGMTIIT
jgi:hypothetical protein